MFIIYSLFGSNPMNIELPYQESSLSVKMISWLTNLSSMWCAAPSPTHAATSAGWLLCGKLDPFILTVPHGDCGGNCWKPAPDGQIIPVCYSGSFSCYCRYFEWRPAASPGPRALWCVVKVSRTQESFNWSHMRPHTSSSLSKDASCWAKWLPFLMALSSAWMQYLPTPVLPAHAKCWFLNLNRLPLQKFFFYFFHCENSTIIITISFEIRNQPWRVQSLVVWWAGFSAPKGILFIELLPVIESKVFDSSGGELPWGGIWSGPVEFCEV